MLVGVPKERESDERRVALVPDSVGRLIKSGIAVRVERAAGESAHFPDGTYTEAGASLADDSASLYGDADLIVKVRKPLAQEVELLRPGVILVSLLPLTTDADLLACLAERRVTALALELVPRITRAQSMDVLSSQSTVAGYKAVLLGAGRLGKLLPMMTTAAGSIPPAKAFILGAGVAGLQAIATARRLGAVVSAFDIRAAAREQVQSVGATFVASELVSQDAEDVGGYAKEQSTEEQQRALEAIGKHLKDQDLVISTAQVPGRPAPLLITEAMVRQMRPGSVIVDLAAETGGNCELTRVGETTVAHGVTIEGPVNLPSTVPLHASQMFSKNVETLLNHLVKDGALRVDMADEITGAMCVTHDGEIRTRREGT
jgi:H+-translocating NAD(P) transhydrogenase subunit alpha